jgi:hypothetical protein
MDRVRYTQVTHLDQVTETAADLASALTEIPLKDIQVTVVYPDEIGSIAKDWERARAENNAAQEAVKAAARHAREAARAARAQVGSRDAAFLLGVSKQRLSQLTAAS